MRLVQILPPEGEGSGGLEVAAASIADGYRDLGHSVERCRSTRRGGSFGWRGASGPTWVPDIRPHMVEAIEVWDRLVDPRSLSRPPGVAALLVVTRSREEAFEGVGTLALPMMRRRGSRLLAVVDRIVVPSAYAAREFAGRHDVIRVPFGVDLEQFSPRPRSRRRQVLRLVSVSGMSARDSTATAIATLRALIARGTAASLTVLGEGDRRRWPESAGLPIRFLGHVDDRALVADTLSDADVTLAGNQREPFGLAALESMACGTPVVVPVNSGSAELVTSGTGISVPAGPRGFASAALEVSGWPVLARRAAARRRAEGFPWDQTVALLLDAYSSVGVDVLPESPPARRSVPLAGRETTVQR